MVSKVVEIVAAAAKTGNIGDGKIFVNPVSTASGSARGARRGSPVNIAGLKSGLSRRKEPVLEPESLALRFGLTVRRPVATR